jgi:hypothetical protein
MYKIFPFATMLSATLWLMVLGLSLMDLFTQWTSLPPAARYAVVAVNGLLLFVTWKPIWQRLWSFSTRFHSWFPDLNGNYDVELRVNWPIQSALLKAAAGNSAFDPLDKDAKLPKLKTVKLKAKLDVGFFGVDARLWSTDDRDGAGVIDQSRSLSATLLKPCDGHPFRLAYIYQQKNKRSALLASDDAIFEGAAILDIVPGESVTLKGEYWTNRGWHKGLSTAGEIIFTKVSSR